MIIVLSGRKVKKPVLNASPWFVLTENYIPEKEVSTPIFGMSTPIFGISTSTFNIASSTFNIASSTKTPPYSYWSIYQNCIHNIQHYKCTNIPVFYTQVNVSWTAAGQARARSGKARQGIGQDFTSDQVNNRKGLQNLLSYSVNSAKHLGSTFVAVLGG